MSISFRTDSKKEKAFRDEVSSWIANTLPDDLRGWSTRPPFHRAIWWHRQLYTKGWIAPAWPKCYGGMEATLNQQIILKEELARAGAPEISAQGINHVGPILMQFGSEEQRERHLPPILTGDETWCQGYSEPDAGSDLSNVKTRAELVDGQWVVNGQKVWTSLAQFADWIFVVARTEPGSVRHAGLSYLLMPMDQPGIEIRPIVQITGGTEFNETFFSDAVCDEDMVVGGVGASITDHSNGCVGDESNRTKALAIPASSSQSLAFRSPVRTTGTSSAS